MGSEHVGEDDGVGLPTTIRPGVGLGSMRERAMELGGQFAIGPGASRGAAVTITIPLTGGT